MISGHVFCPTNLQGTFSVLQDKLISFCLMKKRLENAKTSLQQTAEDLLKAWS